MRYGKIMHEKEVSIKKGRVWSVKKSTFTLGIVLTLSKLATYTLRITIFLIYIGKYIELLSFLIIYKIKWSSTAKERRIFLSPKLTLISILLGLAFGVLNYIVTIIIAVTGLPLPRYEPKFLIWMAILGSFAGLFEEPLFRGFYQRSLAEVIPATRALMLASLAFGLAHSTGILFGQEILFTSIQVMMATLAGLVLGYIYNKGGLAHAIICHGAINFFSLFLSIFLY